MSKRKLFVPILSLALFLAMQMAAWGAAVPTVTQTIQLKAGWNAVYLEVQPQSNSPAVVFKDLPGGSSVWAWQGKNDSVQFIQDPNEAPVANPQWLAIFTSAAESALNNLYAITANSAYLVHVAGNSQLLLNVEGTPTIKHKSWMPDSFNLTGFGFASSSAPTFANFFAPSNSHKNQAIYRLDNTSGAWQIVNNPATTAMRSGEAFWVFCQSGSDYQGPLTIEAGNVDGLDFGAGITILTLTLYNTSTIDQTVSVAQLASTSPVVLEYRYYVDGKVVSNAAMTPTMIKAGGSAVITLAVKRGTTAGSFASVLEFTDGQGSRVRVPVTASSKPVNGYSGLWSGVASLDMVSLISDTSSEPTVRTTPAPLNLNLILHQDSSGQVRLLKQVIVMYKEGTFKADGTPITNGRYVALTKDNLIPTFKGVAQRDGADIGRRLSAIGFDYSPSTDASFATDDDDTTLKCTGRISSTVTCRLVLDSSVAGTHPTNPFLHKYHPDHDNLADDFKTFKPEVNRITRDVNLVFDSIPKVDPTNPPPGWGVSVLGGTYTESYSGLVKKPIKVQGNFTIRLASDVDLLNQ